MGLSRMWYGSRQGINAALNVKQQGIVQLKAEGLSVSAHGGSRKSGMSPVAA